MLVTFIRNFLCNKLYYGGLSSISSDGINWTQGSTTLQMQGADVTWCSDINVLLLVVLME